jgi:hypothetical protein
MAGTFTFSTLVSPDPSAEPSKTNRSSGKEKAPKYEDLLETERHAAFQDFLKIIHQIDKVEPTREELEREGDSLRARLQQANEDKLLAAIYGAAGNPVAQVMMQQATQQADLLQYMFDSYRDNPKLYLAFKRAEMLEKVAPYVQAAGQLTAAGGLSKAEALSALAQYKQVGAMYAQASAARSGSGSGRGSVPSIPFYLLTQLAEAGVSENSDIFKLIQKRAVSDKYLNQIMGENPLGLPE